MVKSLEKSFAASRSSVTFYLNCCTFRMCSFLFNLFHFDVDFNKFNVHYFKTAHPTLLTNIVFILAAREGKVGQKQATHG